MAEEDDLDLNVEEEGGSKKKLFIIIGIAALLLIGGGVAVWSLLGGDDGEQAEEQVAAGESEDASAEAALKGDVSYVDMSPAFVANLSGKPRMLQVGLQLRVMYPELPAFVEHNAPAIRHAILNLLSVQDGQALQTREAKDRLREEIKAEINKLIDKYKGPGKVDEVLFSSFVTQ
jgi:flagellar FliL protein